MHRNKYPIFLIVLQILVLQPSVTHHTNGPFRPVNQDGTLTNQKEPLSTCSRHVDKVSQIVPQSPKTQSAILKYFLSMSMSLSPQIGDIVTVA